MVNRIHCYLVGLGLTLSLSYQERNGGTTFFSYTAPSTMYLTSTNISAISNEIPPKMCMLDEYTLG